MKITKTIAEEVSIKMSEKIYGEKIKMQEDLLLSLANQEVLNSIPSDLMDVFNKYRPYLKTSYCVGFKADTLDNLRINVDCFPSKSDWYPCIEITRKNYESMISIKEKIKKYKQQKDVLQKKINGTLLSLGTYKKVEDQFVEAIQFFDKKEDKKTEIDLPIKELKELFKQNN